jgi:hypothetical protein
VCSEWWSSLGVLLSVFFSWCVWLSLWVLGFGGGSRPSSPKGSQFLYRH